MQTYIDRAKDVVWNSQLTVQVLLSAGNDDLEFIVLDPCRVYMSAEEFTARKLRSVGFVGLNGLKTACAFKEVLEPSVVSAIAVAFAEYVRVLLGADFVEHAEIAELERMYSLADARMN